MKRLVEFRLDQGGSVLVEVDELPGGPVMRGLGKDRSTLVEEADKTFEDATAAVVPAAGSLIARLRSIGNPPDEVGIEFGVQLSAQTGAFIASVAAEANFKVSMTWRRSAPETEGQAMQELLDFDVAIEPLSDGYRTRVVASPVGDAAADFAVPFTDKDLEILVLKVVGSVGQVRRKVRRIEPPERRLLEDFGGQLFQAAFSGHVRECLGRSRLVADSRGAGLRIRLRLPPALANIPWEYLYDAEYGFVSLSPETALVRYVEMPAPVRPFPISPPLRILAMISAPSDVTGLQDEEEWRKLNDALSDLAHRGMVEVDRLDGGTLSALQRPLRLHEYHVLHFVGHGGYDEDAQDGALALEGADRKTRLVTGRDLGLMIRGHRSLRLVVLNACEGARSARDDPFGGVAQALVRQGIPAVIAMQFEISDSAALVFSQSFYQAIADDFPVDVAMVEARRAMFAKGHEVEWATPVLLPALTGWPCLYKGPDPEADAGAREDADRKAPDEAARHQAEEQAQREVQEAARTSPVSLTPVSSIAGQPGTAEQAATPPGADDGGEHPRGGGTRRGRTRWLWAAGGVLALAVAVAVVVIFWSRHGAPTVGPSSAASTTPTVGQPTAGASATPTVGRLVWTQLLPGDCLTGSNMQLNKATPWPLRVQAIPCGRKHTAEVYYSSNYWPAGQAYPGDRVSNRQAASECVKAFRSYIGIPYSQSVFGYAAISPGRADWDSGVPECGMCRL